MISKQVLGLKNFVKNDQGAFKNDQGAFKNDQGAFKNEDFDDQDQDTPPINEFNNIDDAIVILNKI